MSLGRYHLLEGDIPRKDVPGKVSSTRRCLWESVRKRMSLGRRDTQEGDVPEVSPGRHSPGEDDVPRKQTHSGRCHPLEGDIPSTDVPGEVSSAGMCHWEEDVHGKKTSLRKETSPFKQPKPMEPQQCETGDTVILGQLGGTQEDTGDTMPAGSSVHRHLALINVVLSSP